MLTAKKKKKKKNYVYFYVYFTEWITWPAQKTFIITRKKFFPITVKNKFSNKEISMLVKN